MIDSYTSYVMILSMWTGIRSSRIAIYGHFCIEGQPYPTHAARGENYGAASSASYMPHSEPDDCVRVQLTDFGAARLLSAVVMNKFAMKLRGLDTS